MRKNRQKAKSARESLIQLTLKTFQPFYVEKLSDDDALEIVESLTNYSRMLREIKNCGSGFDCEETLVEYSKPNSQKSPVL